jgi:hypothetical protein
MFAGLLRGAALGAGAMYFLDPIQGRRRRSLVRDQFTGLTHRIGNFIDKAVRDAEHRIVGTVSEFRGSLSHEQISDDVLVERVRSKIGRCVSHPRAIEVSAYEGRIVLSGPVLEHEVPELLKAVWGVRGVQKVEDHTITHTEAENLPELRGGRQRAGGRSDPLQANWSPATRLFMGGLGTLWMVNCATRRTPGAVALGTLGFGLFLTSMQNCNMQGSGRSEHSHGNGRHRQRSMAPAESGM